MEEDGWMNDSLRFWCCGVVGGRVGDAADGVPVSLAVVPMLLLLSVGCVCVDR